MPSLLGVKLGVLGLSPKNGVLRMDMDCSVWPRRNYAKCRFIRGLLGFRGNRN